MENWLYFFVFTLLAAPNLANNTTDIPECVANEECPTDSVCAKQRCIDPCAGVCGSNTVCHVTNHVAMCACSPGHSGHPIVGCSASRGIFGQTSCTGHDQCPASKACIQGWCADPCEGLCGDNTSCTVLHHLPACACKKGHTGNPFLRCTPQADLMCLTNEECATDKVCTMQRCVDPCGKVCGSHTECRVTNHVAICSCSPGYSGNPILGCFAPPDVPRHSGCTGHDQCSAFKACIQGKCSDPCDGLCGYNTSCTVLHHLPACACKEGHIGNPFLGCSALQGSSGKWPPYLHQKKIFYVEKDKKADWHEALMLCLRNQSRLVSVDTLEELEEIKDLIRQTGRRLASFWTSGSDYGYEGDYVWASTGKHLSTTPASGLWMQHPHQPDNYLGRENCVEMWERYLEQGYFLNDSPCQHKNYYICEYYV